MKKSALAALILIGLLLAACAPMAATQSMESAAQSPAQPNAAPAYGETTNDTNGASSGQGEKASDVQRIVIMNANLDIVVAAPATAMETIAKMANDMGGFVVSSNLFKTHTNEGMEVPEANITVRVPSERLNEAMGQIKALVTNPDEDILKENVSGQDVTREYIDLQSRLRNLEQKAEQLRQILAKADKTEDVLNVYNQLTQVTEQIEVLKGQIRYYDESAQLSAITVRIVSKDSIAPLSIGGWKPVGTARDAVQALIDVLKFLANSAIWIVILCLPIGLLLGAPAFFIIRGYLRLRARRKRVATEANTDSIGS